jgi:cellulose synthase/poly-beta-1,6-N-acetylglucosamine synthase-like glycosyltransferase
MVPVFSLQVILSIVVVLLGLAVTPMVLVFFVQCMAAWIYRDPVLPSHRPGGEPTSANPTNVVLMCAHDEELIIGETLAKLKPQLGPNDRVLVVADNCSDRTAVIAREAGADVIERQDATRRGKSYAIVFGIDHLRSQPPEVVTIIDADTDVSPGALRRLVQMAAATGRVCQATYLMRKPAGGSRGQEIAAFAFLVKNVVRPMGQAVLGLPSQLYGAGAAFPWQTLETLDYTAGTLTEDTQLGIDLTLAGNGPLFVRQAHVESEFPTNQAAQNGQRKRWEHGYLTTILTQVPRILTAAVLQRRPMLLGVAADVAVPPLALVVLGYVTWSVLVLVLAMLVGSWWPAAVMAVVGSMLLTAVLASWAGFATDTSLMTLLCVPLYIVRKVPIYLAFLADRQQHYVRTSRQS